MKNEQTIRARNYKQNVSFTVDKSIIDKLNKISEKADLTKSKILNTLLKNLSEEDIRNVLIKHYN